MPGQTVAVNVQMVLEMAGNIFPAFGEGVQCVGAVLEPWWSKKTMFRDGGDTFIRSLV